MGSRQSLLHQIVSEFKFEIQIYENPDQLVL